MTATLTAPTTYRTTDTTSRPRLVRTGVAAGVVAGAATSALAAVVDAAGVSLKVGGEAIPVLGFAQVTFVAAMIGTLLAVVLRRRAANPQRTFVRTTVALTALSFVPDVLADAPNGTRLALAISHVVAAAIVIPALASRLSTSS
jgi:uncharacterized protein DUF6069